MSQGYKYTTFSVDTMKVIDHPLSRAVGKVVRVGLRFFGGLIEQRLAIDMAPRHDNGEKTNLSFEQRDILVADVVIETKNDPVVGDKKVRYRGVTVRNPEDAMSFDAASLNAVADLQENMRAAGASKFKLAMVSTAFTVQHMAEYEQPADLSEIFEAAYEVEKLLRQVAQKKVDPYRVGSPATDFGVLLSTIMGEGPLPGAAKAPGAGPRGR